MFATRLHYILLWTALVAAFTWPALINGGVLWFTDSLSYLNGPRTALAKLFGAGEGAVHGLSEPQPAGAPEASKPYAGRSIYFGFYMYGAFSLLGGLGIALANAAVFVTTLMVALRPFFSDRLRGTLFVCFCLALLTSAPFFASYAMPDLFAGIAILAAIRLLGVPDTPTRAERLFFMVMLVFALVSHTSHILVVAGLAIVAPFVFRMMVNRWNFAASGTVLVAVGLAVLAEALFTATVVRVYQATPLRPPFLSARLIDDGPGYDYLVEHCAEQDFALCQFLEQLPQHSDTILWSKDPKTGVYALADDETKRALSDEQFDFALAVLKDRPLEQLAASLTRFGEQLRWFGLEEFQYFPSLRATLDSWFSGKSKARIQQTALYTGEFLLLSVNILTKFIVILSIFHLANLAYSRRQDAPGKHDELRQGFTIFAVLCALAILGNAAVAGILSTPHSRYQARVIWLLPMLSAIVIWRDLLAENMRLRSERNKK